MLLKFIKFKTPTMRNRTKNITNKYKYTKILSKFVVYTKKKSGRNNSGKITVRGRQKSLNYITTPTILIQKNFNEYFFKNYIYNNNKKKKYHIIQTYNNIFYAQPAINFIELGIVEQQQQILDYQKKIFCLGSVVNLYILSYFVKFSNITIFNNKIQYTKSPGTYSLKIKANKKEKMLQVILPSKKYKFLPKNTLVIIGTNESSDKQNLKPGKAGYNRLLGFRPISRGVARNPVDHPNGGRTKSCQPEKSPWGWVAKHNK